MNIFLTGKTGFIGKNLYEQMRGRYTIYAPTRKELNLLDGEEVIQYVKRHKINTIIHTAIQSGENVLESTLRMFLNLTHTLPFIKKMIHLGSGAEYGKTRDLIKIEESAFGLYIPADQYGLAKYICSQLARHEKKIITLRLFGIYGKYEDCRYKFISNAIAKNILRMPIKIKQNVIFDYLYIDDIIPITDFFLRSTRYDAAYNITPTDSITLKKIAHIINKISSFKSPVTIENNNYNFQYTGSNQRLLKAIPDFRFTSYHEGIKDLFMYYSKHASLLDRNAIIQDVYLQKAKTKSMRFQ